MIVMAVARGDAAIYIGGGLLGAGLVAFVVGRFME